MQLLVSQKFCDIGYTSVQQGTSGKTRTEQHHQIFTVETGIHGHLQDIGHILALFRSKYGRVDEITSEIP